jgi:ribonuclease P protein component
MRRMQRLRQRRDFAAVQREGTAVHGDLLSVRVLPTTLPYSRFGFAVSRRVGTAVARNRVKRRLRAAVMELRPPGGFDVIVTARAPAATATYHELKAALARLLRRARVLERRPAAPSSGP